MARISSGKTSLTVRYALDAADEATKKMTLHKIVCVVAVSRPRSNSEAGEEQHHRRGGVGGRDHRPPPDGVEQPADGERPEEIAGGEGHDVEADVLGRHVVEGGEHERVGEEDRVVEERLRDHEAEPEQRAPRDRGRRACGRRRRCDVCGRTWMRHRALAAAAATAILSSRMTVASIWRTIASASSARPWMSSQRGLSGKRRRMKRIEKPSTAPRPNAKRQPSAMADDVRIEQQRRRQRAQRGADPVGAVERDVGEAAHARRQELVDGRVHGRALAADAEAGERAEEGERGEAPRQRRQRGGAEVDTERDQEQLLAPEPIGEAAEEERAGDGAGDVRRRREADVARGQPERARLLQHRAERADDGDLEPVEDPGDAERDDDEPVPARPRQAVEPRRDVGLDHRHAPSSRSRAAVAASPKVQKTTSPGCSCAASQVMTSRTATAAAASNG